MVDELNNLYEKLSRKLNVEDIFGKQTNTDSTLLMEEKRKIYYQLIKICHSDLYISDDDKTIANNATQLLNQYWSTAKKKILNNTYGQIEVADNTTTTLSFSTRKHNYTIIEKISTGSICAVFKGIVQDQKSGIVSKCIIKIPHSDKDNDLMQKEAIFYNDISKSASKDSFTSKLSLRIPTIIESIKLSSPTSRKISNTFLIVDEFEDGWYSLEQIREKYPNGVNTKIMAFIFNRILEGLTLSHHVGYVHGALTPNHILVHTKSHMGQIIDWSASVKIPSKGIDIPYLVKKYREFYPHDILYKDGTVSSSTDIYMAAWNMVYILGGDVNSKTIPDSIESEIKVILNRCLQPNQRNRYKNVTDLYNEINMTYEALWGKRSFTELSM